jgi:hypothetical protein
MPDRAHAAHGLALRAIAWTVGAFVLTIVIVGGVMHGLATRWNIALQGPNAPLQMHIEGANLESAPQIDRARYFAEKEQLLRRYEWIDRDRGVARIPIDEAMRMLARGRAVDRAEQARR